MPRHPNYIPHGVIPAVLLPFDNDLAIDEQSFRKHLRDVASVERLSAITINAWLVVRLRQRDCRFAGTAVSSRAEK